MEGGHVTKEKGFSKTFLHFYGKPIAIFASSFGYKFSGMGLGGNLYVVSCIYAAFLC